MIKRFFFSAVISLFFAAHANAWDMGSYVENAQAGEGKSDSSTVWDKNEKHENEVDSSMALTKANAKQNEVKIKHHAITFSYGIYTLTDLFGANRVFASTLFSFGNEHDELALFGAFSLDYGYKFDEYFETGLVFNYAHPTKELNTYSFMPKFRINLNGQGFIRPFLEADVGFMIIKDKYLADKFTDDPETSMLFTFNVTFAGLEIGHYVPLTLGLLSFGQRGLFYAGLGFHF